MFAYLMLTVAIVAEVIATSSLRYSEGFTKLAPSVLSIIGYSAAFYSMSLTLKSIPVGIAYAIWSGVGIVAVSIIDFLLNKQKLDIPALIGMLFIMTGVATINLFSKTLVR